MEPRVVDNPDSDRYEIYLEDELAGIAEYRRSEGEIAFIHTEVAPEYEGRGLGGRLARTALDAAREEKLAVLPFCPYIRAWISKHPEYVDLVPEDQRSRFDL